MTVNLTGEFFKDFSQKQDGRFPAGEREGAIANTATIAREGR